MRALLSISSLCVFAYLAVGFLTYTGTVARTHTACTLAPPSLRLHVAVWPLSWPLSYGLPSAC